MRDSARLLTITIILCVLVNAAYSQTLKGVVKNSETQEVVPAVSIMLNGTTRGTYSSDKGEFQIVVDKFPATLVFSSVGYTTKEVVFNDAAFQTVLLQSRSELGQAVVVGASRLPENILTAPVSVERVSAATIRNAPGASYYDVLANLKGVDITTSSYTFKTVSTRGFNGSGNLRFNQLVDGMDNAAPALNFSVGNVIGITELDVDNMELLSGATSALYGSGGMNGTLLVNSKDPFKYQGLSLQVKQGVMHIGDYRKGATPFYDWSLRWGKKVSEKFAFKLGAEYIKADDWRADDSTNLLRNNVFGRAVPGTRASDPNYDGVNVFGDEVSASMKSVAQAYQAQTRAGILGATGGAVDIVALFNLLPANATPAQIGALLAGLPEPLRPAAANLVPFYFGLRNDIYGGQYVSRTGYYEKDMVNYDAYNIKFSGGLYYKINERVDASLTGNWGLGTSVYTGSDRYSLKNFVIGQYKLEFKGKSWNFKAYTTQENSGDSYASTLTAIGINNAWKPNGTWFGEYVGNYSGAVLQGMTSANAHAYARGAADQGRYLPGTTAFNNAFNTSVTTSISNGGSQFADQSDVYHFEGQWNLSQYVKVVDVLVGASYRLYNLDSKGTIFADTAGAIKTSETGGYIQLQKALFNDVLKLSASGRYDKNKNFEGRLTPRFTATIRAAEDNHFRLSYQQAYRFPDNQDQWINLKTPGYILIGCLPGFNEYYHFSTNPVYTSESVIAYRASVDAGTPDPTLLKQAEFKTARPETMESFEIGYRGIIAKKLLVDAYYYLSTYKDFIGRVAVARGSSGNPDAAPVDLASPFTSTNFSFVSNTPTPVKANGWGVGAEYQMEKGYRIAANAYGDQLRDVPEEVFTAYNTPKFRYNLGFSNANLYKGIGFNVIYKWQDKVEWQGTFAGGTIPSFGTLDAQLSYKWKQPKILFKLGGTNVTNHYYRNAFGNPYIGALYYLSIGYNVF